MDFEALSKKFWTDGYLILEDFFDAEMMDHLNEVILEHFGDTPDFWHNEEFLTKSQVEIIPWFPQQEGITDFDLVGNNLTFQRLTAAIIGEESQEQYSMVMYSRPGSKGQSWHQDCALKILLTST